MEETGAFRQTTGEISLIRCVVFKRRSVIIKDFSAVVVFIRADIFNNVHIDCQEALYSNDERITFSYT